MPPTTEPLPWADWHAAVSRPEIESAISGLYAHIDEAVAQRGATCWASGRCCRFDVFEHRLYVTGLEIARFLSRTPDPPSASRSPLTLLQERGDRCPYQVDGLCGAHDTRPMGCRLFFCQRGTEVWQRDAYEQYLAELRDLHEREGLAYHYLEWRAGLASGLTYLKEAQASRSVDG